MAFPLIAFSSSVKLATVLKDVYGQTNSSVIITCYSQVYIRNEKNTPINVTLGTKICAENQGCDGKQFDYLIKEHQEFSKGYSTVFMPTFNRPGQKTLSCINSIDGNIMAREAKYSKAYIS